MSGAEGANRKTVQSQGPSLVPVRRDTLLVAALGVLGIVALCGIAIGVATAIGMSDQVERARRELATLEGSLPGLQTEVARSKVELEQVAAERRVLEDRWATLQQTIQDGYASLAELGASTREAQKTIDQAALIKPQLESGERRLATLQTDIYSQEQARTDLGLRVGELEGQVRDLLSRVSELSPKVVEAEVTIQRGEDAVRVRDQALKDVEAATLALQTANEKVASAETKVQSLDASIAAKNRELVQAEGKVKVASDELARTRQDLDAVSDLYVTTSVSLAKAQSDLQSTRQAVDSLAVQKQQFQGELEQLQKRRQGVQADVDALDGRTSALRAEVSALEAARQQLQTALTTLDSIKRTADALDRVFGNLASTIERANASNQGGVPVPPSQPVAPVPAGTAGGASP